MKFVVTKDYDSMTEELLKIFAGQIRKKPDSVLSFTTGATPRGLLDALADEVNGGLDVSACTFCNLDEYVGKRDGAYSVYRFMNSHFYDRIEKKPGTIFRMDAEAVDRQAELLRYGELLKQHPRDIQLLGLGTNGHIGANEPGTPFDSTLFVADSCESTIQATQDLFGLDREDTPTQMFTMGFREIMEAGRIVLAASGRGKAEAVRKIMEGGITEDVPASILKRHPDCIFIVDEEAASLLAGERRE